MTARPEQRLVGDGLATTPACGGKAETLTFSFKARKLTVRSLRLVSKDSWAAALQSVGCQILSSFGEVDPEHGTNYGKHKAKPLATAGVTGYFLSRSSCLFVSDSTLYLKSFGPTWLGTAIEPILDVAAPFWRQKCPEQYLKYMFMLRAGVQMSGSASASWAEQVDQLEKMFHGEGAVMGSVTSIISQVYVANYVGTTEIVDAFSTQLFMETKETSERAVPAVEPLNEMWQKLHGDDPRSISARATFAEHFDTAGYMSSGVFGKYFTTVHDSMSLANLPRVSIQSSAPFHGEARDKFIVAARTACSGMCPTTFAVAEFALSPQLFGGDKPVEIPGFTLVQTAKTLGRTFACSLHSYRWEPSQGMEVFFPSMMGEASCMGSTQSFNEHAAPVSARNVLTAPGDIPVVEAASTTDAPLNAAISYLQKARACGGSCGGASAGVPMVATADFRCGQAQEDIPVALLDVSVLRRRAELWRRLLPRVEPFYAVKCNSHPTLVNVLWGIWQEWGYGGFDCASPVEMDTVQSLGVPLPDHVVYANPCKQGSAVEHARTAGVKWVVFDNSEELLKMQRLYPTAELLLRVQTDDSLAQCPLSNKFGASVSGCAGLLAHAKALGLNVVGVSFHVGSGCSEVGAFRSALARARAVFDEAINHGFEPTLLDIGGGFPGWDEPGNATFADHAADITEVLEELFPSRSTRVIAEPGRFFAATSQALLTTVVSVADAAHGFRYYLNDGLYGSFNCLLYDHAEVPKPIILRDERVLDSVSAGPDLPCTVFGPTCDGFDVVSEKLSLPKLQVGDRLLFKDMGAYTSAASTSFNGFVPAATFTYRSQQSASSVVGSSPHHGHHGEA